MNKKEQLKNQSDAYIKDQKIEVLNMPKWVSFMVFLSVVVSKPIGYVPIVMISIPIFLAKGFSSDVISLTLILASFWLLFITLQTALTMSAAGVLGNYLSMIYTERFIPSLLMRYFSK